MDEASFRFVEQAVSGKFVSTPITGDASLRKYYRISFPDTSYVLCIDRGENCSISSFLEVQKIFFKSGVPVPRVIAEDDRAGLMLLEDLGDTHVESFICGKPQGEITSLYQKLVDIIVAVQLTDVKGSVVERRSFNKAKLIFEFNFFIEHCLLGYLKSSISEDSLACIRAGFEEIAEAMQIPSMFVPTHRDYHSRNILINSEGPVVIDFQDAMLGLPQYDFVSLIEDPYVNLSSDVRRRLKTYCFQKEHEVDGISEADFDRLYALCAYQRLIKAMGTYGFQITCRNNTGFIPSIHAAAAAIEHVANLTPETAASRETLGTLL